ncbi:MAG: DUF1150 family protein [Alphaproteobacteria bacterium]|nr:DUF1150 family protein [Alphaproteobacteria bacterium]
MIMTDNGVSAREILKNLSARDFLSFGVQQIAYVRPVRVDEKTAWSVHAADGTPLTVLDSLDIAEALIRHNELEPVTVQ